MIAIKSTNPIELEKLCLLKSKISDIENLFQVTEKAYRKLIDSLFVKEIDECLAYNYPITTQDCILSLTCEENSSSSPETKKCTASTSNLKEKKYFVTCKIEKKYFVISRNKEMYSVNFKLEKKYFVT